MSCHPFSPRACAALLLATAAATAQEVVDLVKGPLRQRLQTVGVYNPKVPPQVRCLRSDDEATAFSVAAWGEDKSELHVDYDREQILVVAWGALRFAEGSAGWGIGIHLEQATIDDEVLRATVRTVLPPGPGIELAADRPGRTWYPSVFARVPRTERAVVDVIGGRRRAPFPDFAPAAAAGLEVRVAPDASPARERIVLVAPQETAGATKPKLGLFAHEDRTRLEIAWGELGPGAYRLELVGAILDGGVARLTVRADNRLIVVYSGPGVHYPALALELPKVDKVLLHIERVGVPLEAEASDFEPRTDAGLVVTVDRSALPTPAEVRAK